MPRKNSIRRTAFLSLLAAIGVVCLYLGSLIELLDMTSAVLASLITAIAVIEYGGVYPFMLWGVTSVLGLVLLPQKLPALMYALFFGVYPILKEKIEKKLNRPIWRWILKIALFNVAILLLALLVKWVVGIEHEIIAIEIAYFALANVTLVLYDVAMTRMIWFYIIKIRSKFKIKS